MEGITSLDSDPHLMKYSQGVPSGCHLIWARAEQHQVMPTFYERITQKHTSCKFCDIYLFLALHLCIYRRQRH